ncbi:integral membrane protein [Rutstroemia sp. NJR-2017a WRK4]|nr:integral membrane protein [Rutstroemia sp. NJR-2017a WRK4]
MSTAAILAMTPEERAMTPAGVPPPGVIPNFINGPTRAPLLNAVGTCMVAIMLVLASLRFYTKLVVVKKTTWDDSGSACKYGTHVWDISIAELLSKKFIVAGFVVNFFTTLVWPFAKLSFFILYHQLFYPNVWLRRSIYLGAYVNVGFYIGILVGTLYFTAPHPGESWEETYLSPRYMRIFSMTIPIAAGSLILDIYIFLLPIFGIWNLQLTTKKKLGIMIVFGTGFTLTEMCVGIAASCMPALTKMVRNDAKWLALRSKISKTFGSLTGWGASKNRSSTYGSKDEPIQNGAYSNLDEELRNPGFELKGIKAVKTTIKSGSIDDVEDDRIHLKYNLRQEVSTHGLVRTADAFV